MRLAFCLFTALMLLSSTATAQLEFGNIQVIQNDPNNDTTSVDVSIPAGQSTPNFSVPAGSNRGDYNVQVGPDDTGNADLGLFITTIRENGRDNTLAPNMGGPGLSYATSAIQSRGDDGSYFIPVHATSGGAAASGSEFNMDVAAAFFPFADGWVAGHATNNSNNGTLVNLNGSPGLTLDNGPYNAGTQQFRNFDRGISELILPEVDSRSAGVLLVTGGKNEDNYALTRSDSDGSFTVFVKDNGSNGNSYENDPVAFAFVPYDTPGVTAGRISIGGDGANGVGVWNKSGDFTLRGEGDGQVRLSIPGQNPNSGTLLISPEGGGNLNVDNIVSYQADGNDWVIQTRDLPGAGLQELSFGEPAVSFAFTPFDAAPTAPGTLRTPLDIQGSVIGGNVEVTEFNGGNGNDAQMATFADDQSTMDRGTVNVSNRGDNGIAFDGKRLGVDTGVLLATSSEDFRDNSATGGVSGRTVAAVHENAINGYVVSTAGFDGSNPGEINSNFAVAHFGYEQGWAAQAGVRTGDGTTEISTINGADSRTDGVLFVGAFGNDDNFATAGVKADGSGWDIQVRDNSGGIEGGNDNGGNGGNRYSYVYVPYGTEGFVGGSTDPNGTVINSQGGFTLTKEGVGQYRLSVPGATPNNAMLLLSANHTGFSADNGLNYEADGDDFIIRGFDGNPGAASPQDTGFNFGVVEFNSLGDPAGPRAIATPRVVAANFDITELNGDNSGIGVSFIPTTAGESTGADWEITGGNRGDYHLSREGERIRRYEGVVLTTVRENFRDNSATGGLSGVALSAPNTQFSDSWEVSTHPVDGSNPSPNEINVNFGAVLIPYGSGFQVGQNFASGSQDTLLIDGFNTLTDGVLIGNGGNNDDNFITAQALPGGDGFTILLNDNSGNPEGGNDMYNYAFLPYLSENLVAGHISADGSILSGTGMFSIVKEATDGLYRLSIDGVTPDDGVLLLTGHSLFDNASADNTLTFMADGNDFLIQGWDANSGAAAIEDTEFQFAFISFTADLQLPQGVATDPIPEPVTLVLFGAGCLGLIARRRRSVA